MVSLIMNSLKIAIYPYGPNIPNKYIDRMEEAIRYAFPNVIISAFPGIKNIFSLKGYNFVWLNWFENLPKNGKIKNIIIREFILLALKVMRIKVIVTLHNREPHESSNTLLEKFLFWHIFIFANRIIILSDDSKKILEEKFGKKILTKTILIPHPAYECKPKIVQNTKSDFKILFFGHLRPYKNIELIFELAKIYRNISFTIAGNPIDKKYETELKIKSEKISNLTLISHFLSEEEIDKLIDSHTILLLPYNIRSSLNSGVVIHAICKRINIIVPEIGTVNQLINKDMIFHYSYDTQREHLQQLIKIIKLAKDEYELNIEYFKKRIDILYDEVTVYQDPKELSKKVKELFK